MNATNYYDNSDGPSDAWWDEAGDAYEQARLDARLKPMFPNFEAYVADWPGAEAYRNWLVTTSNATDLFIVRGQGSHNGLPGGYLYVQLRLSAISRSRNRPETVHPAMIAVGDNDDGLITREFASDAEAHALFSDLKELAPFDFDDLVDAFGFNY